MYFFNPAGWASFDLPCRSCGSNLCRSPPVSLMNLWSASSPKLCHYQILVYVDIGSLLLLLLIYAFLSSRTVFLSKRAGASYYGTCYGGHVNSWSFTCFPYYFSNKNSN